MAYGHGVLLAETFVGLAHLRGTVYDAAGWQTVDESSGDSRRGGQYIDAHDQIKRLLIRPSCRNVRQVLCQPGELASCWQKKGWVSDYSLPALRSLHDDLFWMRDIRRGQGRKHALACAFSTLILTQLSGFYGPLEAIGSWHNPKTRWYVAVSKSTLLSG